MFSDALVLRAASTANVNLKKGVPTKIDGVTLTAGESVLLKDQTNASENGVYAVGTPATRASAYATWDSLVGLVVMVTAGTVNSNTEYLCINDFGGTLGTTPMRFSHLPGFVPAEFSEAVSEAPAAGDSFATSDLVPIASGDTTLRGIAVPSFRDYITGVPAGIDPKGNADSRPAIQARIDALIQYGNRKNYGAVLEKSGDFAIDGTLNKTLVLVKNKGPTTITLNASVSATFTMCVALMADGRISFASDGNVTILDLLTVPLSSRFQAAIITIRSPGPPYQFELDDLAASGGGTCFLPAGKYTIDGNGLKLHPAVNLVGSGMGATFLVAATSMTGVQDGGGSEPALLTVCARAPSTSATSKSMYQPNISDLTLKSGESIGPGIHGCLIEVGARDPYYTSSSEYAGSSATFLRCGVYGFSGCGVFSQADRQRFYCEYLRCLSNQLSGLKVYGNDPVIGLRCGFGSNGKHQLWIGQVSGVIISGVNCFSSNTPSTPARASDCLACYIGTPNGCTIMNSVFNDTLVLEGGPSDALGKGISVTGCDFRPNTAGMFDPDTGAPVGSADSRYDTFIYVNNLQNVVITGNSFCATSESNDSQHNKFNYLVNANGSSRVTFLGSSTSNARYRNYRAAIPVNVLGHNAQLTYSIRDLDTGAQYDGKLGDAPLAPSLRGVPLSQQSLDSVQGYAWWDAGLGLQSAAPHLGSDAALFYKVAGATDTVTIQPGVKYAVIDLFKGTDSSLSIVLPAAKYQKELDIVLRGDQRYKTALAWSYADAGDGLVSGELRLPAVATERVELQLLRKGGSGTGAARWYRTGTQPVWFNIAIGASDATVASGVQYVFRAPSFMLVTEVRGSLTTAASDGDQLVGFDVKAGGITIFAARPQFAVNSRSTVDGVSTAGTLVANPTFDDDAEIKVNVTLNGTGTTTASAGLKLWFKGLAP
jgi:hypothetical protein